MGKHTKKGKAEKSTKEQPWSVLTPEQDEISIPDLIDDGYEFSDFYNKLKESGTLDWLHGSFSPEVMFHAERLADSKFKDLEKMMGALEEISKQPGFKEELYSYLKGVKKVPHPDKKGDND